MPEQDIQLDPNSQVVEVIIGVHNLRKVRILPLSIADQFKVMDLFVLSLQKLFVAKGATQSLETLAESVSDKDFAEFLVGIVKDNLERVLLLVLDDPTETWFHRWRRKWFRAYSLLNEITNAQALEIAGHIYRINFGDNSKNLKSLLETVTEQFQSGRPSQS